MPSVRRRHPRRRGELDRTLVVFSSDHGEMLGDHNRWGKSVPWHESVGVPLVAAGPGVEAGVVSDALVSLVDLAATFLDHGGVAVPRDMDSRTLRPLLAGRMRSHRDVLRSGLGRWRMAWDGTFKLIRRIDPEGPPPGSDDAPDLLFDTSADPHEEHDIAARDPRQVARLREAAE